MTPPPRETPIIPIGAGRKPKMLRDGNASMIEHVRHVEPIAVRKSGSEESPVVDLFVDFTFDPSDVGVANVADSARVTIPGGLLMDTGTRIVQTFPPKIARYIGELILAAVRTAECPTCGPQALVVGPGVISAASCACPPE